MSTEGAAIEVIGLTKNFGDIRAVDDLAFAVQPGTVTGFLGPNGAGKTTTLRMLLGLVTPDAGSATIGGRHYAQLPDPTRTVGAALEASSFHPGRRARDHLRVLCRGAGLPDGRADEVLAQVGLSDAASRRVGGFSMGMRQRLALASALIGDPQVLVRAEPANGLDPEGIAWLRGFLRFLADQGRPSSSRVTCCPRWRRPLTRSSSSPAASSSAVNGWPISPSGRSRAGSYAACGTATARLADQGYVAEFGDEPDVLVVTGADSATVGRVALREEVELHELTPQHSDLEQVFLELTTQGGMQ